MFLCLFKKLILEEAVGGAQVIAEEATMEAFKKRHHLLLSSPNLSLAHEVSDSSKIQECVIILLISHC